MIKEVMVEEKTHDTALNELLEKMNCELKNIYYIEEKTDGGIFKIKKIKLTGISHENIKETIINFFDIFSNLIRIKITVEIKFNDDIINISLDSSNNSILIGNNGKTINSLQIYLNNLFSLFRKYNLKINLDIAEYKKGKIKVLEKEITKIIKEVLDTQIEVKLDPMNSYQRRIVHNLVSKYDKLTTESIGEEPNRYVIIKPSK